MNRLKKMAEGEPKWYFELADMLKTKFGASATWESDEIEIEFYSPAGEDVIFYVSQDIEKIADDFDYSYMDFDVDEHVCDLIRAEINGVSGIPSVRDLVDDAEKIEKILDKMSDAVRDFVMEYQMAEDENETEE